MQICVKYKPPMIHVQVYTTKTHAEITSPTGKKIRILFSRVMQGTPIEQIIYCRVCGTPDISFYGGKSISKEQMRILYRMRDKEINK